MSIFARLMLIGCTILALPGTSHGAEPRHSPTARENARTLVLLNQPVVMLQATYGQTTPEERVNRIVSTLRDLSAEDLRHPVETQMLTRYQQQAVLFIINKKPFMLLSQNDLDEGDDLSLPQAALRVQQRLENLRAALSEQYSNRYLLLSTVKTAVGLVLLIALCLWLQRGRQAVRRYCQARELRSDRSARSQLRRLTGNIEVHLATASAMLIGMLAGWFYLSWVLRLFPWTRIWGMELGAYTLMLLQRIGLAVLSALPGLCVVLAIVSITALLLRLLRMVLQRVESGSLQLPGVHRDTVGVTRRLVSVVIWLFALSAAYPFLPGADSLAFKGISVFLGLMLTLGSAGVMNHAMSGLVLTYSRALRRGDVIRITDHEGQVSEVGMLATKLLTRENYEVTIPNAVVVSGKIVNLSSQSRGRGVPVTTSVTIGYDTPWRQVHAMLELAASRTAEIQRDEPVIVRQLSLMDWYIAYELQVIIHPGASLAGVRSELHGHIQDVFNEFGVQIMSPNFVGQPEGALLVQPEDRFRAPANPPEGNISR